MNDTKRILREAKQTLELAVTKALTCAPLTSDEWTELSELDVADLMRDYACDLFMANQIVTFVKSEKGRFVSQRGYDKTEPSIVSENSVSSLRKIMSDAKRVRQKLDGATDLPPWCENKIKKSQELLHAVDQYLNSRSAK